MNLSVIKYWIFLGVIVTALVGCSSQNSFTFSTLSDALDDNPNVGGTTIDSDGDGLADGIDFDGDGEADVDIVEVGGGTDGGGDDGGDDPPPVRDETSGKCIPPVNAFSQGYTDDAVIDKDVIGSKKSIIAKFSSHGKNITIDLAGVTDFKQIVVVHSGGSNTLRVRNAEMSIGFCNEGLTGNNNIEVLEDSSSAAVVDLRSGGGTSHSFDVLFTPSYGMNYFLSGNNHCVSYTPATTILEEVGGEDHTILDDGSVCVP